MYGEGSQREQCVVGEGQGKAMGQRTGAGPLPSHHTSLCKLVAQAKPPKLKGLVPKRLQLLKGLPASESEGHKSIVLPCYQCSTCLPSGQYIPAAGALHSCKGTA